VNTCGSTGNTENRMVEGWREAGTRLGLLLLALIVLSNSGLELWGQLGWGCSVGESKESVQDVGGTRKQVLSTITGYCLPKLVCQLYAMENRDRITDSERNLITLVGSAGVTGSPSKYSFAAHMGQLVRGMEGTGCHNFYPDCPFSNQDVLQIARRINFQ